MSDICANNLGHGHAFNRRFGSTYKCQWCGALQSDIEEKAEYKSLLRENKDLKEQNALLTVQVQGLRDALEDLLEQFDPRNHQTYCECDPSVGYQCAACKFPSIPAVGAAHDALSALPQSEDVRDSENLLSLIGDIAKVAGRDVPDCVDNDGQPYQSAALDAAIKAVISAQD